MVLGAAAAGAIMGYGISHAQQDEKLRFDRVTFDLLAQLELAVLEYVLSGLWVHQAAWNNITRQEFRLLYDYIISSGLVIQGIAIARKYHA